MATVGRQPLSQQTKGHGVNLASGKERIPPAEKIRKVVPELQWAECNGDGIPQNGLAYG